MPRSESYSKEDAQKILVHYRLLLVGKVIEETNGAIIDTLKIDDWGDGRYGVIVEASYRGSVLRTSVFKIAQRNGLQLPSAFLQMDRRQ